MAPKIEPREDTLSGISQNALTSVPSSHYGKNPRELFSPGGLEGTRWQPFFLGLPRGGLIGNVFSSSFFLIYYEFNFYKDLWVLEK